MDCTTSFNESWLAVQNTIKCRLIDNSLTSTFSSKRKTLKSTVEVNKILSKNTSYKQFKRIKTEILKSIKNELVTEESGLDESDYESFYNVTNNDIHNISQNKYRISMSEFQLNNNDTKNDKPIIKTNSSSSKKTKNKSKINSIKRSQTVVKKRKKSPITQRLSEPVPQISESFDNWDSNFNALDFSGENIKIITKTNCQLINEPKDSGIDEDSREDNAKCEHTKNLQNNKVIVKQMEIESDNDETNINYNNINYHELNQESPKRFISQNDACNEIEVCSKQQNGTSLKIIGEEIVPQKYKIVHSYSFQHQEANMEETEESETEFVDAAKYVETLMKDSEINNKTSDASSEETQYEETTRHVQENDSSNDSVDFVDEISESKLSQRSSLVIENEEEKDTLKLKSEGIQNLDSKIELENEYEVDDTNYTLEKLKTNEYVLQENENSDGNCELQYDFETHIEEYKMSIPDDFKEVLSSMNSQEFISTTNENNKIESQKAIVSSNDEDDGVEINNFESKRCYSSSDINIEVTSENSIIKKSSNSSSRELDVETLSPQVIKRLQSMKRLNLFECSEEDSDDEKDINIMNISKNTFKEDMKKSSETELPRMKSIALERVSLEKVNHNEDFETDSDDEKNINITSASENTSKEDVRKSSETELPIQPMKSTSLTSPQTSKCLKSLERVNYNKGSVDNSDDEKDINIMSDPENTLNHVRKLSEAELSMQSMESTIPTLSPQAIKRLQSMKRLNLFECSEEDSDNEKDFDIMSNPRNAHEEKEEDLKKSSETELRRQSMKSITLERVSFVSVNHNEDSKDDSDDERNITSVPENTFKEDFRESSETELENKLPTQLMKSTTPISMSSEITEFSCLDIANNFEQEKVAENIIEMGKDIIIPETQVDSESQEFNSPLENLTESCKELNCASNVCPIKSCDIPAKSIERKKEMIRNIPQLIESENLSKHIYECTLTLNNISEDDEIFILNIPKNALKKNLIGQKLIISNSTLQIGDNIYEALHKNVGLVHTCVLKSKESSKKRFKAINIRPVSTIVTRRKKEKNAKINDFQTLPELMQSENEIGIKDDKSFIKVHKKKKKEKLKEAEEKKMLLDNEKVSDLATMTSKDNYDQMIETKKIELEVEEMELSESQKKSTFTSSKSKKLKKKKSVLTGDDNINECTKQNSLTNSNQQLDNNDTFEKDEIDDLTKGGTIHSIESTSEGQVKDKQQKKLIKHTTCKSKLKKIENLTNEKKTKMISETMKLTQKSTDKFSNTAKKRKIQNQSDCNSNLNNTIENKKRRKSTLDVEEKIKVGTRKTNRQKEKKKEKSAAEQIINIIGKSFNFQKYYYSSSDSSMEGEHKYSLSNKRSKTINKLYKSASSSEDEDKKLKTSFQIRTKLDIQNKNQSFTESLSSKLLNSDVKDEKKKNKVYFFDE